MGEVILLDVITKLDIPVDRVIEGATGKLDQIVIMGYDKDGNEYFSSSFADSASVLWMIERMKKAVLESVDDF